MEYLSPTNILVAAYLAVLMPWSIGFLVANRGLELSSRWLLGCGLAFLAYFTMYASGIPSRMSANVLVWLSLACLVVSLIRVFQHRRPAVPVSGSLLGSHGSYVLLFCLVASPFLIENLMEVARGPLEAGDALACYYNKAKYILNGLPLSGIPYAHYPNFPSVMWSLPLFFIGDAEFIGRMCFSLFLCVAMVSAVSLQLQEASSREGVWDRLSRLAVVLIAALFTQKMLASTFAGSYRFFGSGYVDCMVLVFGLVTCANFLCLINTVRFDPRDHMHASRLNFAFFMAGILANTKNEGSVYAVMILAAFLLALAVSKQLHRLPLLELARGGAIFAFMVVYNPLIFRLFGHRLVNLNGEGYSLSMFLAVTQRFSRLPIILGFYSRLLHVYWIEISLSSVLALLCFFAVKRARPGLIFLVLTYAGMLAFCGLPQLFVDDKIDYQWLLNVTFERLFFQHYFLYVLLVVFSVSELLRSVGQHVYVRGSGNSWLKVNGEQVS